MKNNKSLMLFTILLAVFVVPSFTLIWGAMADRFGTKNVFCLVYLSMC